MTGSQLQELRTRRKLSRRRLAELMGVHVRTLKRWELGEYPIPQRNAIALRHLLTKPGRYVLGLGRID